MSDDLAAADRPSFTSFWRRGKQKKDKAQDEPEGSPEESSVQDPSGNDKAKTDKEKAQARRAQVRRAQIQHRQRKANYIKQLELDVSQLRDLVSVTEKETSVLAVENAKIREMILAAGLLSPPAAAALPPQQQQVDVSPPAAAAATATVPAPAPTAQNADELFADIDVDDLTVTLSMDEKMGTPCFHISSRSASGSSAGSASAVGPVQLTSEQEQRAINFILTLEHVCWNHFSQGDFHSHDDTTPDEKGHALMASSFCMAAAPDSVYTDRQALEPRKRSIFSSSSSSSSAAANSPVLRWATSGMTLDALYGLAMSLNPGDQEIAPVQAWFELASRYSVDVLFAPGVLEALEREFKGVVRCVMFGAAIERLSFESVIARVLGSTEGSLY